MQPLFLLGLGCLSKQAGDEGNLPADVFFVYTSDLSLANHVHGLVPLERSTCRFNGKEAQPRFDQPLDEAVVLLDNVVEVFDWPQFARFWNSALGFELIQHQRSKVDAEM
jgi:hypothetical protein